MLSTYSDNQSRKVDMPRVHRRIRYTLRNRELLRQLMDHPGRGTPYTVRSLAEASGCSRGRIGHLLSGEQDSTYMDEAHAIAEAVGVAILVLFAPPVSPNADTASESRDSTRETRI